LPACKHVGLPGAIKDDRARPLKGTDSNSSRKQRACRKHGNQKNDDHFSAHRRRDYTTSYIEETLKVFIAMKILFQHWISANFSILVYQKDL
jgi:hypothetical protein